MSQTQFNKARQEVKEKELAKQRYQWFKEYKKSKNAMAVCRKFGITRSRFYYWKKRNNPASLKNLLKVHIFGNLFAFMFVSIHFAQQMSRPSQFFPYLGTGIVLYPTMLLLVATGFIQRFLAYKNKNSLRFIHGALTLTFYLTIIVHILHGIVII